MDLNVNIGDLFKKKGSGSAKAKGPSNPFLSQIIISFLIVGLAGGYFGLYWLPESSQLVIFKGQVAEIDNLKIEREQLDRDIVTSGQQLADAKKRYQSVTRLFHTDQELEDLYRRLSTLALQHGLMISKVIKGVETPIYGETIAVENSPDDENPEGFDVPVEPELDEEGNRVHKEPPLYYRIKVVFQILGRYPAYVAFRRDLANEQKIVNIDSELIGAGEDAEANKNERGRIKIVLGLSTYRIAG